MGPSMKEKLSRYFFYFMLYSIIGWIYEVFLEVVIYRWGYSNRGVLFGPYCIIYGVGALILLLSLQGLKKRSIRLGPVPITPVVLFVAIVAITTVVELIGSYIMEWTTGSWMWDYHRFAFNFQGRIALNPSIRFGIGGDFPRGHQVDYVLGHWNDEERKAMPERLKYFGDAILSFAAIGPERTMNLFNKK